MTNILTQTRYVKPGVYIGRIIRPRPVSAGFVRTPNYVAKGNRLQTLFNAAIRRSYRQDIQLTFAIIAPHVAPLTAPADNNQQVAFLEKSDGVIIPTSKWKFIESVPGSNVFDQILLLPEAFDPNTTYFITYQSTSRSITDELGFTDLREIRRIGDAEDQAKYIEGTHYRILMSVTAPAANAANAFPPQGAGAGFTAVTQTAGFGTGVVTIAAGANYTGVYNREYILRISTISGGNINFQWESVSNSGGNNQRPNVPLNPLVAPPTFTVPQGAITTVNLSDPLLGGDLGVQVTINDTGSVMSPGPPGDTWRFTALGPGLIELDERYTNTNQFSLTNAPVATLQPGSTGACTLHDPSEFIGTFNRSYVLRVTAVAGISPLRTATIEWQGFGELPNTFGTITIQEALGSNANVTIEQGIVVDFNFGITQFVVGDEFAITALAPRTQPFAKDDRNYTLEVTAAPVGGVNLFYSGSTPEASFGVLAITPPVAPTLYQWAMALNYERVQPDLIQIPGDYSLHVRNIGATVAQQRHAAADKHTFSSTDLLLIDWTLNSRVIETFDPTQIFTDVLGNITGVAGRRYIILNNVPSSIIFVHNSPAGTPLSHLLVANAPYVAFPTPPVGAVAVRYEFRGDEPDPGNIYNITANVLRPAELYNSSKLYVSIDDARQILGPSAPDNDALIIAELAFDNEVPQMMATQVADTDEDGIFTKFDYEQAIEATERDALTTDVVVINNFDSLGKALASNEAMNDPFARKERVLWVGAPANTAIGDSQTPNTLVSLATVTMQVFGDSQAHGRRVLLGNTFARKTIVLTDGSQVQVSLDGSFVAGASAAKNASFADPGTTLLRGTLAGFDSIQDYDETQETQLGAASILYLADIGAGVFRFEESVTVDRTSPDNNEISAQNQVISTTRDVRNRMDASLISFVPPSQQAGIAVIQTTLAEILTEKVSAGQIAPYTNDDGTDRPLDPRNDIVVFRDTTDRTLYNFQYWYNLRYPIKRLFGLFSVDRRLFGIAA